MDTQSVSVLPIVCKQLNNRREVIHARHMARYARRCRGVGRDCDVGRTLIALDPLLALSSNAGWHARLLWR